MISIGEKMCYCRGPGERDGFETDAAMLQARPGDRSYLVCLEVEFGMSWQYTKRQDGKIAVALDNNVWNFLFDRNMNVATELPCEEFAIFIPREVEIETFAIPNNALKAALKEYVARMICEGHITTTSMFGFATQGSGPQRVGGFGQGTWQSPLERQFYEAINTRYLVGKSEMNSQLTKNEGDAAVAVASFSSIVLTCEKPSKSGPLRFATEYGGKILYLLPGFDQSGLSLREYIVEFYKNI